MTPHSPELILRIVVGALLAAIIGYERELHHRPAGLRTHLLVAISAASFMTISTHLVYYQNYRATDLIAEDPSRIAAAVVTGIGFLGGGAILRTGGSVQGLTTAASLWLVTAIGMTSGAGMYLESLTVTALGFAVLTLLRRFERDEEILRRKFTLTFAGLAPSVATLKQELRELEAHVYSTELDKQFEGSSILTLNVRIASRREADIMQFFEGQPGMLRLQVQS